MTATLPPITPAERRALGAVFERWLDELTPNVLRRSRRALGLSHAEIDDRERQLADAEHASWPGE